MQTRASNPQRGAALMLAMWALLLLSAMIMSWAFDINGRLTLTGNANRALEAEAMASSGSEVAMHPMVKPGSSLLTQHRPNRQSFEVRIVGEGGRVNLNYLANMMITHPPESAEYQACDTFLKNYLQRRGIELNEQQHMIDCLVDWIDPDNIAHLNGAEAENDYEPANEPLEQLEDLKRVRGWQKFTATKDWDTDFTSALLPDASPIDLAWAPRNVLVALPDLTEEMVDRFLAIRRGADGVDGTADDTHFESNEQIKAAMGLPPNRQMLFELLITTPNFPVYRVVSTGKSADVTRVVEMVIRKGEDGTQLISWKEL